MEVVIVNKPGLTGFWPFFGRAWVLNLVYNGHNKDFELKKYGIGV